MAQKGMYEQLDIFSFLQPQQKEAPVLLSKGQTVYLVIKADVIKYRVSEDGESWTCGEDDRGYRLVSENGGYSCTYNKKILGGEDFTDYGSASKKADEYLKTHSGIILAGDIKPISTVAYSYIRDCDNREMTAFYSDLGNDEYYIKEFRVFAHICRGKKAIKQFMGQQEFKYEDPKQIDGYVPVFKNMYKTTEKSDWDYAEYGYVYAVG